MTLIAKAQATNARLREDYPDGFALDTNHAPRTEQSMMWESKATGYYDLAYKNQRIIGAVAPFAVEIR